MVAAREIGSSDRSLEQHVADHRKLRFGMMEDDVPRSMAGAMADVEGEFADRHCVAVLQPPARLERLAGNAITHPVILQPRYPEAVFFLRSFDRHAKLGGEDAGGPAMIDMAMGQQDFLDRHAML